MNQRRRKRQALEIPKELLIEILTRQPVKSLMRFKCVSKLFSSHICSQYFNKRFLSLPSRHRPRLYISLYCVKYYDNSVILSLSPSSDTSSTPSFVVDNDLTVSHTRGCFSSQNLRGFMLHTFRKELHIYNPATRQLVTLPPIKSNLPPPGEKFMNLFYYHLGHDPVNDQYKVIYSVGRAMRSQPSKIHSEHWIFVLKAGGSWKKAATPPALAPHFPGPGLTIDGVIYYLAWIGVKIIVVVSFDIISEEFSMISVPRMEGDQELGWHKNVSLVEYGGKVTLFDETNLRGKGMIDLWVLEDVGSNEWSRKNVVLKPCQLHLVYGITLFKVYGTTQNGKVFLIPHRDLVSPFHVLCYDMQTNDMRRIDIKGVPDHWFSKDKAKSTCFDLMFMDHNESITYLES